MVHIIPRCVSNDAIPCVLPGAVEERSGPRPPWRGQSPGSVIPPRGYQTRPPSRLARESVDLCDVTSARARIACGTTRSPLPTMKRGARGVAGKYQALCFLAIADSLVCLSVALTKVALTLVLTVWITRAEQDEMELRTSRGQWGTEGEPTAGRRKLGRDPFGMGNIEDTARRYEARGRSYRTAGFPSIMAFGCSLFRILEIRGANRGS